MGQPLASVVTSSCQVTPTFSNSVFEAAFLASDFDRVVCTEPQARVSQRLRRSISMVSVSHRV